MEKGKYRDFSIPGDSKKRMIIAPDLKSRTEESFLNGRNGSKCIYYTDEKCLYFNDSEAPCHHCAHYTE